MSESRETELIKTIIDNLDDSETEYTKTPQSRNEEILVSILNETEYTKTPQSREEELLLELKEKITSKAVLIDKNITENGTYNASSDEADGYSKVVVNVAEQNNARYKSETGTFRGPYALEYISIPNGYTSIREILAYPYAGLIEVVVPQSVTDIWTDAFQKTTGLQKLIINKPEGSIAGAPHGAPATCEVIWNG